MSEEEKWFSGLSKNLRIDSRPRPEHRERLKGRMLDTFNKRLQPAGVRHTTIRWGIRRRATRYASAAVLILGLGFLMHHLSPVVTKPNPVPPHLIDRKGPAAMLTLGSLRLAFSKGDLADVERRYDTFFGDWDPGQSRFDLLN